MNVLDKLEKKYGRYAIRNLPMVMIALYVAGYLVALIMPNLLYYLTLEPYFILHGQVWRLLTWVLVPPESLSIFTVIMLFFYFSIGKTLEQTWGAFRFNVYIISGILFTILGSFFLYFIQGGYESTGGYFSTYYINMSIFLAFALTYPDMQVLLYFLIPVKMKWMGILYGVTILIPLIQGTWQDRVAIIASLLNFILFFFLSRNMTRFHPKEIHRRQEFKRNIKKVQPRSAVHKCTICGRTEADGEHLEFRFCSKCDGNHEYCQDHLFTHQHIKLK